MVKTVEQIFVAKAKKTKGKAKKTKGKAKLPSVDPKELRQDIKKELINKYILGGNKNGKV